MSILEYNWERQARRIRWRGEYPFALPPRRGSHSPTAKDLSLSLPFKRLNLQIVHF